MLRQKVGAGVGKGILEIKHPPRMSEIQRLFLSDLYLGEVELAFDLE